MFAISISNKQQLLCMMTVDRMDLEVASFLHFGQFLSVPCMLSSLLSSVSDTTSRKRMVVIQ